jgi:cell division protein FtsL
MNTGGHKTSAIQRPKDATRSNTATIDRADDTRLADFTRPIPHEKQLVKGRGKRSIIVLAALVITAALVAALFVLPVKAWLRQQDDIDRKQSELAALDQANAELADEVSKLNTPEGIEEAAREEIGYVQRGEIRLTVLPSPAAPLTMPGGWPYDAVSQIISVRQQAAVAATPGPTAP